MAATQLTSFDIIKHSDTEANAFFELDFVRSWIEKGNFKRVAIQMADDLVPLSLLLVSLLRKKLPGVDFDLVADSTLGNCCVDIISAAHIQADAVVHFGHSCLFPVSNDNVVHSKESFFDHVSVLLVFCQYRFDAEGLAINYITPLLSQPGPETCLILYDVVYHSCLLKIKNSLPSGVVLGLPIVDSKLSHSSSGGCVSGESCDHWHCCRRCFAGVKETESHSVIYIGKADSVGLKEILLTFMQSAKRILLFDPTKPGHSFDDVPREINRAFGRRLYFIERVRDASSVGLVVSASTAALPLTRTALNHAKNLLKTSGKRVYVFCLGQLTPTKLAAYAEVDAFVFLGCPERALQIDSSEFYKPVVSYAEMEMACNPKRPLDCRFVPDLTDLLPCGSCFTCEMGRDEDTQSADVSLVSNNVRPATNDNGPELSAGERLAQRQWKGLDEKEIAGDSLSTNIHVGRKGIPIRYEEEMKHEMLYYGNLSQDQDQLIDAAFAEHVVPKPSMTPPFFGRPGSGTVGGAGAVPPVVAQLDRENKVLLMADVFLAQFEKVRFLSLLSANPEVFGHDILLASSHQTPMGPPSPILFETGKTQLANDDQGQLTESSSHLDANILPSQTNSNINFPAVGNSLYSDADTVPHSPSLFSMQSETNTTVSTPVASSVRSQMSDSGIPAADIAFAGGAAELFHRHWREVMMQTSNPTWLVSESDVPQKLLPMPFSLPAIPPEWDPATCSAENSGQDLGVSLRGSEEWAPPRFQIIWTLQPQKQVSIAAEKQRYRCAGCGHLVDKRFLRSLRYCHYYGRYFCTQCHTGQKAILPATVIANWDFAAYHVSEQAAALLVGIANEPYFYVAQINPLLFKKHRSLRDAQKYRLQLAYLATYIKQCREAKREQQIIGDAEHCRPHWCDQANPSIYSIADLIGIKNKKRLNQWRDLVTSLKKHVISCQACTGRGYVCEGCWRRDDIIFPFNVDSVVICPVCRFCFHRQCHPHPESPDKCPRCIRLEQRRLLRQRRELESLEETNRLSTLTSDQQLSSPT